MLNKKKIHCIAKQRLLIFCGSKPNMLAMHTQTILANLLCFQLMNTE